MMKARLYLFDDARARRWDPFRLTRPVGELLFGCLRLRERAERVLHVAAAGHLAGEELVGFEERGAPPVVPPDGVADDAPRILLSSRAVLDGDAPTGADEATTLTVGGRVAGWILPVGEPMPDAGALLEPDSARVVGRRVALEGTLLDWPWSLVEANPARIAADVSMLHRGSSLFGLTDVHILGDEQLSLGHDAHIESGVVLDTRAGPVRLAAGVRVEAPARLTGPLYVGEGSIIFGGSVARSSIGPVCKVRGEIDASVLLGFCNKAHDGYLGHALVGHWVNLGALTTNSDLKNNYSTVRVHMGEEDVDTGLLKVGCFLGDHVKTGIGTLLTTGAVVGAGSNIFGGGITPRYVRPFSWGAGEKLVEFRLDRFLQLAEAAMERRGVELTPSARDFLEGAWRRARSEP